jgi:hypothetical protein
MTCEEYRERWLDRQPRADDRAGDRDAATHRHAATCLACQTWQQREEALDEIFQPAFLVAPPPELSARLAQLPNARLAPTPVPARSWASVGLAASLFEVAFLVLIGLGITGLAGNLALLPGSILELVGNVLQAVPLVLNSPLLAYAQSAAITLTEVLATLLIVALGLLQVRGPMASE